MNKLKTAKSISKRFKITYGKKLLRRRACRNHLLEKKTGKRKRKLRKVACISLSDTYYLKNSLSYF